MKLPALSKKKKKVKWEFCYLFIFMNHIFHFKKKCSKAKNEFYHLILTGQKLVQYYENV